MKGERGCFKKSLLPLLGPTGHLHPRQGEARGQDDGYISVSGSGKDQKPVHTKVSMTDFASALRDIHGLPVYAKAAQFYFGIPNSYSGGGSCFSLMGGTS